MRYEKCRKCPYVCRCCASKFMDIWPNCNKCPNNRFEFEPADHVKHCPYDGSVVKED